jgi:hypothetical protein
MPANSSATVPVWKGAMECLSTEGYSKLATVAERQVLLSILTVLRGITVLAPSRRDSP